MHCMKNHHTCTIPPTHTQHKDWPGAYEISDGMNYCKGTEKVFTLFKEIQDTIFV
jgi:hypothetical protein